MKLLRHFILNISLFALASAAMAQSDPVVMVINGKDVKLSEFTYSFKKNNSEGVIDRKTVDEYVPLFVNFKLKVAAAEEARYDTLTSMQNDLRSYREQMLMPTLNDPDFIEREALKTYNNTAARFGSDDILVASHILVLMRQDATAEQQVAAKARIDSIYQALQAGADFAELAKKCSDDKASAVRGGSLGQFGKGMMIPDFEKAAYALQAGQVSQPVKSTVGWHIIKLEDRHPFESYEYHHDNIISFLEQQGIREAAANHLVDSLAQRDGVSRDEVISRLFDQLKATDAEQRFLAQEYYDGSMMFEICSREIWKPAAADKAGQLAYFKKHKKEYAWTEPHYRGIVVYSRDEATAAAVKAVLKKEKDPYKWEELLKQTFNTDSLKRVVVTYGIYTQGKNKVVDKMVFKQSVEPTTLKDFPIVNVYGKMLTKPETMADVENEVVADYQAFKEREWVEQLRQKYTYSVDESVLQTIK